MVVTGCLGSRAMIVSDVRGYLVKHRTSTYSMVVGS